MTHWIYKMNKRLSEEEILKTIKEAITEISKNLDLDDETRSKLTFFAKNAYRGKHLTMISDSTWERYKSAKAFIGEGMTVLEAMNKAKISNNAFYGIQKIDPNPLVLRRGKRAGVSQKMIVKYLQVVELRKKGVTVEKAIKEVGMSFGYFYLIKNLNSKPFDESVA